jgi:hypothetical protein
MKKTTRLVVLTLALIGVIFATSCSPSKTPTITTNSLPEGTEGFAYSQTLQVHGGTPPYTWFAMAALPPGLQLDPLSGVISGTPLAGWGPAFIPFHVADHTGMGSEKQLLITVNPTTYAATTTTTASGNSNSASSSSTNGLSLSLSLDGTTYQPGQSVSIIVDEKNLLSTTNNLSATDNLPSEFGSGFTNDPWFPLGLAVLRGNYTGSNYSTGTPLIIYNPGEVYIGTTSIAPTAYSFSPFIDVAVLNGGDYNSSIAIRSHIEINVNGYWPNNESASSKNFEPGVYTVVAGDEWGNLIVVHFTVSQ